MSGANPESVVIVGAGQAGGRAAEALRAARFAGSITLIGDEVHLPYERPQLSKSILLDHAIAPAFLRSLDQWSDLEVEVCTGTSAVECDYERRLVGLADGREYRFDRLLLATGTRPRRLAALEKGPIPVHYLRNLNDALSLRGVIESSCRILLIGGGVIGLEVAAAAVSRGCSVTIVEAAEHLLAQVGARAISDHFKKLHVEQGVRILTGVTALRSISGAVELSDGSLNHADVILVGIGVQPSLDLARALGLRSSEGIRVDARGATELEGVYAAGDVALQWNRCGDRWMRIENWANALNQAGATAAAMVEQGKAYDAAPWFWSDQYATNLQVAGSFVQAEEIVRGDPDSGRFSVIGLRDGEIVGAATVNASREMALLRRMVSMSTRPDRASLEDPATDLRRLLSA